jgi:hypothetical protein
MVLGMCLWVFGSDVLYGKIPGLYIDFCLEMNIFLDCIAAAIC